MFYARRTRHSHSGRALGSLCTALLAGQALVAGCGLDERKVEVVDSPSSPDPRSATAPFTGAAGAGSVQNDASESDGSTTVLSMAEGAGAAQPIPLSLGQACSAMTAPCEAALSCVDGSCRLPCVTGADCASLGVTVECRVGAALDGGGVGACSYQSYCDPAHPQLPVAGATACAVGLGCRPSESGSSACEPRSGGVTAGGACRSDADCVPDHFCNQHGTCRRYCLSSADCGSEVCSPFEPPRRAGDLAVGYCASPDCDPVRPQAPRDGLATCPAGSGCTPARAGEPSSCDQRLAGASGLYGPCAARAECTPDLFCGGGDFAGACYRFCTSDGDCPGERCKAFESSNVAITDGVGFCATPCNPADPSADSGGFSACPTGFGCVVSQDLSHCVPGGPLQRYERCTGQQCGPGHSCGRGNLAFCRERCLSDADCSGNERCRLGLDSVSGVPVGSCVEQCSPVDPQSGAAPFSPCPVGFACLADEAGLSLCSLAGDARAGDPCSDVGDCAAGLFCDPISSQCHELCFSDDDCETGSCNGIFQPPSLAAGREVRGCY